MDPLSVTANLIAVLQLTNKAIKYLVNVQGAPKECQSCATELSSILTSLISLNHRAEEAERAQIHDPWFEQLRALNVKDGPLDQYNQALQLLLSKTEVDTGLKKVKKRLVWHFEKEQVTSMQARIERLKSLIAIALLMDHMALSEAIKADISSVQMSLSYMQADVSTLQTTVRSVKNDTTNIRDNTETIRDVQGWKQDRIVLEWLSGADYPAQRQAILSQRQEGTAQWFLDSAEFRHWMTEPTSTLFCPGMPGAGKTMMAAVAINHLAHIYEANDNVSVTSVFCNYKAHADQSATSLVAAILKQLAPCSTKIMHRLSELHKKRSKSSDRPSLDELMEVISTYTSHATTTYIVIDALDECSNTHGARDGLIKTLLGLQATSDVRLLFTSRDVPDVTDQFRSYAQLEVRASEEDVRRYIEGQEARLPRCVRQNDSLRHDVQNKVAAAVDGMFLLARLHLDSVCAQTSPKRVRAMLAQLRTGSDTLDAAYSDALTRIDGQLSSHKELAQRALCWVSYAERQLTTQELCIALAIEPSESALDVENLDDIDEIISYCAGLMTVDHEGGVVRLVHYTTQEYLQRVRSMWVPSMQHMIAEACLTYLSFEEFRSGACTSDAMFEARLRQHQFLRYAANFWSCHVRPVEQSFTESVMKVLDDDALRESVAEIMFKTRNEYFYDFPRQFTGLHMVAHSGLLYLAQHCLEREPNRVNDMDSEHRTPIHYACENGHERMVKLLLDRGADSNTQDRFHVTPLYTASEGGHEQIVKLLLDNGADINPGVTYYDTARYAAVFPEHEQIVKLLFGKGADIETKGNYYDTALCTASRHGYEEIVKLLLDKGANVNARGTDNQTALYIASACGHEQTVKLLLTKGADFNPQDRYYQNALYAASEYGREQIVKLLLDEGADINARGGYSGHPVLYAASKHGHEQIVKLLLDKGADINAQAGSGNTAALHAASINGHEQTVKLLLDRGADINIQGGYYNNALCAASAHGHEQTVKLLLDEGADINAAGRRYDHTALYAASEHGHEQIVKLLLDNGADINAKDKSNGTALYAASEGGHEQIVKLLLDKGASW